MLFITSMVLSAAAYAPTCANTTAQCAGTGGSAMPKVPCCDPTAHCEVVNQYYSKCVEQPTCAKDNAQCAGKEGSVMEPTPCCTAGFVCRNQSADYWSCVDGGTPPKTCAQDGEQCGGTATTEGTALAALLAGPSTLGSNQVDLPCCGASSKCEAVNQYYSKCVNQPACAASYAPCNGTKDHVMEPTPCCDDGYECAPWGTEWGQCREKAVATCSRHEEQCAGTGASAMPTKTCCQAGDVCTKVNVYYSKCDTPPGAAPVEDEVPALLMG